MMIELIKVVKTIDITNMSEEELKKILKYADENELVIRMLVQGDKKCQYL